MYGVGWFSAYLIWINLTNFSSLIHIESMLARLAGSLVLFVLREFSFECSRSHSVICVESRQEFSGWELLLKGSIPDHLYSQTKNRRIFSLDKSTQEIQRKKQRW